MEAGDPEIMDQLPQPDFENWTAVLIEEDLIEEESDMNDDGERDWMEEYSEGFTDGVAAEIHRMYHAYA